MGAAGVESDGDLAMQQTLTLRVNGQERTVTTDPGRYLLDVLREDLGLTGAKYGCGDRQCGACTVLVNGRAVFSCATRVATVRNPEIRTIEGLADSDQLHPLQEAFLAEGTSQCGYCTPGMILNAVSLLNKVPHPTEDEIRAAMQRNICRCGTHTRIIAAIARAANGQSAANGPGGQP